MLHQEKYRKMHKDGKASMPGHLYDRSDKRYFLKWAEYIYSLYCSNNTLVPCGGDKYMDGKSISELRAYAMGYQNVQKYKDKLDKCDEKYESLMNINWDTVKIMPKFCDIVRGKYDELEFEISTQAVDSTSRKEKTRRISSMKLSVDPRMKNMIEMLGRKPTDAPQMNGIENDFDVQLFEKLGGIRLAYEIMMQDAISLTEYESDFQNTLKDECVDDIVHLNMCASKTYIEKSTGKVKERYVDPEYLVCRSSKRFDNKDIDFAGEIRRITISQLRMESDLTEREIYLIAKDNQNKNGNSGHITGMNWTNRGFRDDYFGANNSQIYDSFTVDILDFNFVASEYEKYIMGRHHKTGNLIYKKVKNDAELNKTDLKRNKRFDETYTQYVWKCKWVIGSKNIYDYGVEYGVAREGKAGNKRVSLPYHIYKGKTPSIVSRCIPFIDDLHLAVYKKRNTLAKIAPGPRIALDMALLNDTVLLGKKTYDIPQLIEVFQKNGVFVYKSKPEYSAGYEGGSNRPPMQFVTTGVMEDVRILMDDIAASIAQIRDNTGINEVADGTVNQDVLVGVMEGLDSAANNSLRPTFRGFETHYRNCGKHWIIKWQTSLVNGDIEAKYLPIGDKTFKTVKITKELMDYEFGLMIDVKPTKLAKQSLMAKLADKQQKGEISIADSFVVETMVENSKIKKAQLYLAKAVEQNRRKRMEEEMAKIKAQAQANAESAQATKQAETAKLIAEYEKKKELAAFEAKLQEDNAQKQHIRDMELAAGQVIYDAAEQGREAANAV